MSTQAARWFGVSITVTPAASEAVEFAFNCLDSLGTAIDEMPGADTDSVTVIGYFSETPPDNDLRSALENALRIYALPDDSIISVTTAEVVNEDWLAGWKKHWTPTEVGRFVIAATWHEVDAADKTVIRIEPNMAFGTGTHETTRLCLAAIDDAYIPGLSFLDVGTGTGILAIAAAKITPRSGAKIAACDTDADSIAIAAENAALNGVGERIEFRRGPITDVEGNFDFVCANLTAPVIIPILPLLLQKAAKTLVMSGILESQERTVIDALPLEFAGRSAVKRLGEWIAVTIQK